MSTLSTISMDSSVRTGSDDAGGAERLERQLFVALLGWDPAGVGGLFLVGLAAAGGYLLVWRRRRAGDRQRAGEGGGRVGARRDPR